MSLNNLSNSYNQYLAQESHQILRHLFLNKQYSPLVKRDDDSSATVTCGGDANEFNEYGHLGYRIGAIFVILATSLIGMNLPLVLSKITKNRPNVYIEYLYLFARYFGSGVILATAFIHLLAPACNKLYDPCLDDLFGGYDWAPGICLISCWFILLLEVLLNRYVEWRFGMEIGDHHGPTLGAKQHSHSHEDGAHGVHEHPVYDIEECADGVEHECVKDDLEEVKLEPYTNTDSTDLTTKEEARSFLLKQQLTAFIILESGIILHSVIIGLTTAVSGEEFKTLFPVIIFHQAFEGCGLGSRLTGMAWGPKTAWVPWVLGVIYSLVTPIGMAAGLGVREHWDPLAHGSYAAQGVLDAISSGILVYAGLVELLAHDFLFSPERERNWYKLIYLLACSMAGTGVMALLGKWA
ncbi:ZIP zinc transporter Zrt1 [Schizosaccharomyces pombe]